MEISQLFSGIAPAIIVALVLGKFAGIFIFSWLTIRFGLAPMPEGGNWARMASVSMLGGIGFTVSLFIANLSFGTGDPVLSMLLNDSKARNPRGVAARRHTRLGGPAPHPAQ